MKKRVLAIILFIAVIISSLSGCKDNNGRYDDGQTAGGTLTGNGGARMFASEIVSLPDSYTLTQAVKCQNNIVFCCKSENEKYYIFQLNLSDKSITKIEDLTLENVISMDGTGRGITYVLSLAQDGRYMMYAIPNKGVGNIIASYSCFELPLPEELSGAAIWDVKFLDYGYLIRTADDVYAVTDNGDTESFGPYPSSAQIIRCLDDSLLIVSSSAEKTRVQLVEFDPNSDRIRYVEKKNSYLEEPYTLVFGGNTSNEIFGWNADIMYSIDCSTDSRWGYSNTYASGGTPHCFVYLSDGQYFASTNDGRPAIWSVKQAEDVQVISLATCLGNNAPEETLLKKAVSSFNAMNASYRIDILDYGQYNTSSDMTVGLNRLNADIAAGNVPDIYDLWSLTSVNYISKGLVADLKPFFEADRDIDYSDLIPSVANALEKNGRLYDLVPSYTITTVFTSDARIGNAAHMTLDDFLDYVDTYGAVEMFGADMTKEKFLTRLISYTGTEYIDRVNAKCSFDTPEFARILQYVSKLPNETDANSGDWERIYYGEQYLYCSGGSNIIEWLIYSDAVFGGNAKSIGFPSTNGNGVAMTPNIRLGMSASSENQEGVWAFFSYLLSDSFQCQVTGAPIMKKALDQVMDRWIADMDGITAIGLARIVDESVVSATVPIQTPDSHTKDRALSIIDSIDCINEFDRNIYTIIATEASAYFSGDKTAEQAASNIQSRVSIYLAEQYS